MKVVLFCGGQGMRLRDYSETIPKPLVNIGYRPILWHLMSYYAHFGHLDFTLCLGHRADAIKQYFLNYDECLSNDFVLSKGGRDIQLLNRDIDEWTITFADTGVHANIGQRLVAAQSQVGDEDVFMANYADGLTDLPLDEYVDDFLARDKVACFVSVIPHHAFHLVEADAEGLVRRVQHVGTSDVRINGGFFIFRRGIFDYIKDGEELVEEPFQRLIRERQLVAYRYDGFWQSMDTFKDKQRLDELWERGDAPWRVWSG